MRAQAQAGSALPTALVVVCRARATRTHYFFVNKKACCICSDISVSCMSIAESTSAVFSDLIAPWSWAGPIMSQFLSFSRLLQRSTQHALKGQIRLSSGSVGGEQQQIRRETLFFDPQMQQLLLRLQGRDHTKVVKKKSIDLTIPHLARQVFRTRKLEVNPDRPVYQFMTQQVFGTVTHGYVFLKGGVSKGKM